MEKSKEQRLIDDGGIRLRCSEPGKIKCTGCGDTSQTPEEWADNDNACPICDGSPQIICVRCERKLDAPPLGDHPCHSLDVYREKGQVVFAEEIRALTEERERREELERREQVEREARASRERVEREARAARDRAERERAERERAEMERVERERVERERVDREARAARDRAERERATRTESSNSSGTLWKLIAGAAIGAVLVFMFNGKEADKSKSELAQKPAETTKIAAPESVHSVNEKEKAEKEAASTNSRTASVAPQATAPVVVQSPSVPVDLVRAALSVYQVDDVVPHLDKIIAANKLGKDEVISQEVDAILKLSRPARGERKIARAANDSGLAAMQQNAFDEAVTSFAAGVKADPADQEIVDNLASALLKSRRLPEAGKAAIASLMLNPMRASAWANFAAIVAQNGYEDLAIASYQLAYRFSRNQEKTREYLEQVRQADSSLRVREAAAKALAALQTVSPQESAYKLQIEEERKRALQRTIPNGTRSAILGESCRANSDCIVNLVCWRGTCDYQ